MKIAIDTMGGDLGPVEVIKGAYEARKEKNFTPVFIGKVEEIEEGLKEFDFGKDVEIVDAREMIENDEEPALTIRKKKNSPIVVGANLLADGEVDSFLSSGSTGALLAAGLFIVKRIEGVERAAISVFLPTAKGKALMLDAGANMDSKPEYLLNFAIMGSIYSKEVEGIESPRIALLNVGLEEGKGNKLTKEVYELLKEADINFIGNIEAREILSGDADIIVTDGFAGNIALKAIEGTAKTLLSEVKKVMLKNAKTKFGALLIKNELKETLKHFDYRETGAAPLLGIRKPIFKAHGSSDYLAYKNAIFQVIKFSEKNVIDNIIKFGG
ncbi:MAG: phosphate acyltransferase PlsX [Tissierellia bacterium]|nr:phosphate acyltransferase PlsX [Tissierellia bacterium]